MKRVLLVGGAGYIGSSIAQRLHDLSVDFVIFDLFDTSFLSQKDCFIKNWQTVKGDIRDESSVLDVVESYRPTHVIHLAALHYIPYCNTHIEETVTTNVAGLNNVIKAIESLENEPIFIFTSSAAVYAGDRIACESDDLCPTDVYGLTKYTGELLVKQNLANYRIPRLFNVFGNHDPHQHLIPKIYQKLANNHTDFELGSSSSMRDYVHVEDVARAFLKLLDYKGTETIFNIGTGASIAVKDLIEVFEQEYSVPIKVNYFNPKHMRANDKQILKADIQHARAELEWSPEFSLAEGIRTLW